MHTPQTQIYSYGHPEMSTIGIFRGRNVQAIRSVAEMSLAKMSEQGSHSVAVTNGELQTQSQSLRHSSGLGRGHK